jgi:hypothetical protein
LKCNAFNALLLLKLLDNTTLQNALNGRNSRNEMNFEMERIIIPSSK